MEEADIDWPHCLTYADMVPKNESNPFTDIATSDVAPSMGARPDTNLTKVDKGTLDQVEVHFLGTVSAQPTPTRAHSCLALRLDGEIWLFDAGEGAQLQLTKSSLKSGKVNTIFITHLHGDHVFGLGPLVCSLAQKFVRDPLEPPTATSSMANAPVVLEIYGPSGTRAYLRNVLKWSYSFTSGKFRVHELLMPGEIPVSGDVLHPCEELGKDIMAVIATPDSAPVFQDILVNDKHRGSNPHVKVHASPIRHTVPTLGFVVEENAVRGNIPPDYVREVKANPGVPLSVLRLVSTGESYVLPNGTVLEPPAMTPGRKVCILGDTCDPSNIQRIAQGCDLLIHEATNAYVKNDPATNDTDTKEGVRRTTVSHGHSTPEMAGAFATKIDAKVLILNHFSARYKGDSDELSVMIMDEIRNIAKSEFCGDVYTAWDWSAFSIPRKGPVVHMGRISKVAL